MAAINKAINEGRTSLKKIQRLDQPVMKVSGKLPKGKVLESPLLTWMHPVYQNDAYKKLIAAYGEVLKQPEIAQAIAKDHLEKTPFRVAKALYELLEGYRQDPAEILKTGFSKGTYNQMVTVYDIDFTSLCAHHMLPFKGKAHFAYIPNKMVVGLSKIPRMVEALARRLQVQESLSEEIVEVFQKEVKPKGCAVLIEASHMCAGIRGVKKEGMGMRTVALRGIFLKDKAAHEEFLMTLGNRRR